MVNQGSYVSVTPIELCPNCASRVLKQWCVGYDQLYLSSSQEFVYSKCKGCGILLLSTLPLASDIHKFYPQNYGPYLGTDYSNSGKLSAVGKPKWLQIAKKCLLQLSRIINPLLRPLENNSLKEKLDSFYNGGQKVFLDFGCGSEHFLNSMRNIGWSTIGMDFSSQAIESVKQNGHEGILYDSEEVWPSVRARQFDVVRMNHVIEHLYYPKKVMKELYDSMSVGGKIHIATPNSASVGAYFFKRFWLGLDCPRHIMIYTPETLKTLLQSIGFKDVRVYHETLTKDFARSIGFYEFHKGWINHQDIHSKISDKRLVRILYGLSVFSTLIKRSDRIHVFATK